MSSGACWVLPELSFELLETLGFEEEERSLWAPCATQVTSMLSSWYQMSFEVNFIKWLGMWIPSLKLHFMFIFWLSHSHKTLFSFKSTAFHLQETNWTPKSHVFFCYLHIVLPTVHMFMGGLGSAIKISCCLESASQQGFLMIKSWCGYTKGNGTIIVRVTAQPRLCLLTWMIFPSEFCQRTPICSSRNIAMTELTFFFLNIYTDDGESPERDWQDRRTTNGWTETVETTSMCQCYICWWSW